MRPPAPASSLARRLLTAAVATPIILAILIVGNWLYLLFVEAIVGLGLYEFYRMARAKGAEPHVVPGIAGAMGLVLLLHQGHSAASGLLITGLFLLMLVLELYRGRPAGAVFNIGATALGVFYVGWLGSHLALLSTLPQAMGRPAGLGGPVVIFTFLVTWLADTGAYFVGRAWGRHPLFAAVSPRKSVEGFAGGLAASTVAGMAGGLWILPEIGILHAVILGAVAGIVGPMGDLVESLFKRDLGFKDSADTIPGHGGVLDRFDSLLFVAPVFYYYLKYMVFRG